MTAFRPDPNELSAAIAGLERTIAGMPDSGHVLMSAGAARLLNAAALAWLVDLAHRQDAAPAEADPQPPSRGPAL